MRATVWVFPKIEDEDGQPAVPLPADVPVLKFVKDVKCATPAEYMAEVRAMYPNPDVSVEFGPIGEPWSTQ